jgi:hypothetical protein
MVSEKKLVLVETWLVGFVLSILSTLGRTQFWIGLGVVWVNALP